VPRPLDFEHNVVASTEDARLGQGTSGHAPLSPLELCRLVSPIPFAQRNDAASLPPHAHLRQRSGDEFRRCVT